MSTLYRECADTVRQLAGAVADLERAGRMLDLTPLREREWYQLLQQKLLPQLHDDAFLVVAVVGGTNIGKSVIFNHLAGRRASATSPLASGTKHPVCLVPEGFPERHDLAAIFQGFELHEWAQSENALEEHAEHRLYWQISPQLPENLLVLDTPDIDSDAPVNWQRADIIRRSADILIAVLTQQKYNDAAVKQFFRRAAAEDKAVMVVFNQCQLPEDEEFWPLWLGTFCGETAIIPEIVYVAPNDRRAAEENRLTFFERTWPVGSTDDDGATVDPHLPRDLATDLSRFRFEPIKLRTLRGSLRQLQDVEAGVPGYLQEVRLRSAEFRAASERFSSESVVRIRDWPSVPAGLFVDEIRKWWRSQQEGWARRINTFYDAVGKGVMFPIRFARDRIQGEPESPVEQYRRLEWTAILRTVEEIYEKLGWMSESGSELLQPHFRRLLAGQSREELIEVLRREHAQAEIAAEISDAVRTEMSAFQDNSPDLYRFSKQLSNVSAVVRPTTSVVLFSLGWGPAGHAVAPLADAAAQALVHVVADFAGGTAAAVAGEAALSEAAGQGAGLLQAKFRQMQATFTAIRAAWLARLLKEQLLGTLPEELQAAAAIPQSEPFTRVKQTLDRLERQLREEPATVNPGA